MLIRVVLIIHLISYLLQWSRNSLSVRAKVVWCEKEQCKEIERPSLSSQHHKGNMRLPQRKETHWISSGILFGCNAWIPFFYNTLDSLLETNHLKSLETIPLDMKQTNCYFKWLRVFIIIFFRKPNHQKWEHRLLDEDQDYIKRFPAEFEPKTILPSPGTIFFALNMEKTMARVCSRSFIHLILYTTKDLPLLQVCNVITVSSKGIMLTILFYRH